MPPDVDPIRNLEEAHRASERLAREIDAVPEDALTPQNVEMVTALSIAMSVNPVLQTYRPAMVEMPGFQPRWIDSMSDYARATWFLYVNNFPQTESPSQLEEQLPPLRSKLMTWAIPLAQAGIFSQTTIDKIREGTGPRDAAGDVVALVTLYRSHWDQVRNMCGVTEEDLDRASRIAPAVFAAVARRETEPATPPAQSALRLRKSWTLLDRAYTQCRRALGYIRYFEGDVDTLLPSLRRSNSPRRTPEAPAPAEPATPSPTPGPTPIQVGAPVGGGASPFVNK